MPTLILVGNDSNVAELNDGSVAKVMTNTSWDMQAASAQPSGEIIVQSCLLTVYLQAYGEVVVENHWSLNQVNDVASGWFSLLENGEEVPDLYNADENTLYTYGAGEDAQFLDAFAHLIEYYKWSVRNESTVSSTE